jgi:NADPH:quinone reductase-like Zn-dependent oxidoreductase
MPVPRVDANEVLIQVRTASVAVWDAGIRQTLSYIQKPSLPFVLGNDGVGTVAAVGPGVSKFKVGDTVYAYCWDNPKGGFYAEYVAASTNCVARLPKGVSVDSAGALGASGLTALQGLDSALHIKSGEKLIIYGASGAVGTLAVQLAKVRGAKVMAIASGEDGVALVRRLGADVSVDGRHGDIAAAARSFAPGGADALLALAGGDDLQRAIETLRRGGRTAYPFGVSPEPKPRDGITIKQYNAVEDDPGEEAELAHLNEAIEAAKAFQIPIAAEFPLADASRAHQRLAAGHVLGKILLRVSGKGAVSSASSPSP